MDKISRILIQGIFCAMVVLSLVADCYSGQDTKSNGGKEKCISFNPSYLIYEKGFFIDKSANPPVKVLRLRTMFTEDFIKLMQKYGFNQSCKLLDGKDDSVFSYHLVSGKAAVEKQTKSNTFLQYCHAFDVNKLGVMEVKEMPDGAERNDSPGTKWQIMSVGSKLGHMDFPNKEHAELAINLLKKYGFTHYCEGEAVTYWLSQPVEEGSNRSQIECAYFDVSKMTYQLDAEGDYGYFTDKMSTPPVKICFGSKNPNTSCLALLKKYNINQLCWTRFDRVDRAGDRFLLSSDKAPAGSYPGEKCVKFDPEKLEVQRLKIATSPAPTPPFTPGGYAYYILNGNVKIFGPGEKEYTEKYLELIKNYGFTHKCTSIDGIHFPFWRNDGVMK